jgi:hypothetical protein
MCNALVTNVRSFGLNLQSNLLRSHPFTALIPLLVSLDDEVLPKLTDSMFAPISSIG